MDAILFWILAAGAVIASVLVIGQRNPMYSVLLLIASFGALSGLYILLGSPFVAVIQIIIYAGAIMVLFLFVVMLLNVPTEEIADRAAGAVAWRRRAAAVRRACCPRCSRCSCSGRMRALSAQPMPGNDTPGHDRRGHRRAAVPRVLVRVRSDVGADSGRDGRRRDPGAQRAALSIPEPTLNSYLMLSAVLFAIGTAGVFLRRNMITILLSIEVMLNAVNLTFVAVDRFRGLIDGQIIVFFVMTVAAAEAAVGLAIVIALFRHKEMLTPDAFTSLKW